MTGTSHTCSHCLFQTPNTLRASERRFIQSRMLSFHVFFLFLPRSRILVLYNYPSTSNLPRSDSLDHTKS